MVVTSSLTNQVTFNTEISILTFVRLSSVDEAGPLESAGCVREGHHAGVEPPQRGELVSHFGQRELGCRERH